MRSTAATPGMPVVLVGHSLGGYLAMAYAAAHPDRLAGLALLGASAVPAGPGAALYRAIASVEQRLGVDRMSRALDRQFDAHAPRGARGGHQGGGLRLRRHPRGVGRCHGSVPARRCSAEVTCPVLLLNGQLDQLRVDARRFARAARSAPWVRVVTVRHGLHVFPLTHPHDTAAALWELLSAVRRHAAQDLAARR